MKKARDPLHVRQSLLQLLKSNPPNEEKLLAEFARAGRRGEPVYSSLLNILTHLTFSEAEARRHWKRIEDHRQAVKAQLHRDIGLRVSILDYFVNVNRELKNPKVIEISIYERTERSAVTDGLTGLFNHAYFLQALQRELQRSKRHRLILSLAIFDLDDFKKLNDTRGHLEGDRVLMKAASLLRQSLREIDIAARYGGEEFVAILPDTGRAGALVVADRVRSRLEAHFKKARGGPRITLSGGVAAYPEDAATAEDLIRRADEGLYRSKADGKNRITLVGIDRRRYKRLPAALPVQMDVARGATASARSKNVSAGGLLVTLRAPVPLGSRVSLVIRPEGKPALAFRGTVVRVDAVRGRQKVYDVAVELVGIAQGKALMSLRTAGGRV